MITWVVATAVPSRRLRPIGARNDRAGAWHDPGALSCGRLAARLSSIFFGSFMFDKIASHLTGASGPIVTLQAHILEQEATFPQASGALSWILSALSISTKMIAARVRRARLEDVLGVAGGQNVQGEQQQKLDVIANEILLRTLGGREGVAIVASEENEEPVILRDDKDGERRYCVLFDPLDGSSNLDVCGGVGTNFSILRHDRRARDTEASLLQRGSEQVAAG